MGPASAETVLREALQRGADRAILLSSPAFAGSDTWCTSLVLAAAVRKIGAYDLLFFGKMAIDGDTAQVGPEWGRKWQGSWIFLKSPACLPSGS